MDPTRSEAAVVETFYAAFARRDGEAMAAAYAPDASFRDPAFGTLRGPEVGAMWRMLTADARDLVVSARGVEGAAGRARADWTAEYTFSATGRHVVNHVHAELRIAGGLIEDHVDEFSFWAWSRQALGPPAYAIGWNPLGPALIRRRARARLAAAMARDT